jgi:hypothetical protein
VPEHDQEKVYTSDIKKILKWYTTLNEFGFLVPEVIEAKETKGTTKVKGATKKSWPGKCSNS